jgi:cytochrome P450
MSVAPTLEGVPPHVAPHLVYDVDVAGGRTEAFLKDPFKVWAQLKELPPLFWTKEVYGMRTGGCWIASGAEEIREILQDPEHFSNVRSLDPQNGNNGVSGELIPLNMDPPDHGKYRALLAPVFSPKNIDRVEDSLTGLSAELIDRFADKGACEFQSAYGRPFPVIVFMRMMGLPLEDRETFIKWEHTIFQGKTLEARRAAAESVAGYMRDLAAERRKAPQDDILSTLVHAEIDGAPIRQDMLEGMCMLLYMAGLDTVAAGLGHTMRFLADHPQLQARLRANPALIPDAIEESIRYHTWIPTGRLVVKDIDFHGASMKSGDWVQTVLYGASNDPNDVTDPETFQVEREPNRHFAFGAGVHRCAGSHLARREMRIGVRMLLERLGEFRVQPGADLSYDGGLVCLRALPLEWEVRG